MNFNLTHSPEYSLYGSLSDELINLYGIQCRYCVTDRIEVDEVLGEHSRLGIDESKSFDIFLLPSETENFGGDIQLGVFGLLNNETLTAFVSGSTMKKIHPNIVNDEGTNFDYILGDLVVFQSGRIMEVSGFSPYVEGSVNNLFVYNDPKNIYRINLRTYIGNSIEKNNYNNTNSLELESLENLEEIFELDKEVEEKQEIIAKEKGKVNRRKPVVSKNTHNSVFGELG